MRLDEVHDHVVVHFVIRFNDVPALERNERHVGPQLGLEGQGLGGHAELIAQAVEDEHGNAVELPR